MQGTKGGNSPCRLSISATDFYVYIRDKYFHVYVKRRKEERNQERKAKDKPRGLAHSDTDFWILVGYTDFSAYVKGRKDGRKEGRKEEIILVDYLLQTQIFVCTLVLTS